MQTARVSSIESLRLFKAALQQFMLQVDKALVEADLELQRIHGWVARDQPAYWANELKKRHDDVEHAKDDLRRVQLTISDRPPSAAEQKKALKRAQGRFEDARRKADTTRHWQVRLEQHGNEYKGQVQHIATAVEGDLPRALAALERTVKSLEAYTSETAPTVERDATSEADAVGIAASAAPRASADPFEGFPVEACRALRRVTPDAEVRQTIKLTSVVPENDDDAAERLERIRRESQRERPALIVFRDRISVPREKPIREERVTYETGSLDSQRIYLERTHVDQGSNDSGWHIGTLSRKEAASSVNVHAATVADVLGIRPEWRELFSLPHGYLAVIDEYCELKRLLDPHDDDLLAPPKLSETEDET